MKLGTLEPAEVKFVWFGDTGPAVHLPSFFIFIFVHFYLFERCARDSTTGSVSFDLGPAGLLACRKTPSANGNLLVSLLVSRSKIAGRGNGVTGADS